MNQIIIEHYKNSCNFLSLKNFEIPFLIDNGLVFDDEKVFENLEDYIGILINKIPEGFLIEWYEDGSNFSEGNYKDGEKEGLWIYWYENGSKLSEGNYKDGKKEGLWIEWYENGDKKSEGNYKDGKAEGFWISWYENEHFEGNYKDGKKRRTLD